MSEGVARIVKVPPGLVVQTPYVLARNSHHLFSMATSYDGGRDFPLAKLYVLCASIELGLKAAMLAKDCTPEHKARMKRLGHDLVDVYEAFKTDTGLIILDTIQVEAMSQINIYFKSKGMEYFDLNVLGEMLNGFINFPSIDAIEAASRSVNELLIKNDFFKEASSSVTPTGTITFV